MSLIEHSGTVYGDSKCVPTPEETPLAPISNYGASKSAVEMYLSCYAELYGFECVSLRLGNIIGPRLTHGVVFDFFVKLQKNPHKLDILGNGNQKKSYMYIDDTINAIQIISGCMKKGHVPINIASNENFSVRKIAQVVVEELNLTNVLYNYEKSPRGWTGDVPRIELDISKLKQLGWKQSIRIEDGLRKYILWLSEFLDL